MTIKLFYCNNRSIVLTNTEKRERFVRLAEGRTQVALSAIRKLGNLSNRRSYQWDETDVKKIMKVLRDALAEAERRFDSDTGSGYKSFKL